MERFLRAVVDPTAGAIVFVLGIVAFYGVGTWFVNVSMSNNTSYDMMLLPWVSVFCVMFGALFYRRRAPVVFLDSRARLFVYGLTLLFVTFCAITILSASSVPLVRALQGASPEDIAVARENFLKARTGWEAILPYLNASLTGMVLPYCMCIALLRKFRFRWLIVALFFLYSLVFVEKAFFLRVFLPLMAVVVVSRSRRLRLTWLLAAAIGLLLLNILLSGFAESSGTSAGDFLLFRIFTVPVSTVTDSLDYWWKTYHGEPLMGATNLVFSLLFGLPRVQFEREVFEYEWGASVTGTGSSNAAFFVEAYVNFGWVGVILISLLVGMLISYIARSRDQALRCTLPLVLYSLFLGGAFGMLFGNGLLICMVLSSILCRRAVPLSVYGAQEAAKVTDVPLAATPQAEAAEVAVPAPLRMLVVSQLFHPESFRINSLCEDLVARGHRVTVLTGQPNYPSGVIAKGYKAWSFRREQLGNVEIIRVPLYPRKHGSAIHLSLNYLSFVASGLLCAPFLLRGRRFDAIFVYAVSPLLQALPAVLLKWLKRTRLIVWVQDLWPESLEATGFVKNRTILGAVAVVVRFIYWCADSVLVQSEGFIEPVARLCARDKIQVFPNSAESVFQQDGRLAPSPVPGLEDGFSVVFAGNLGTVQALPTILDAAERLRDYGDIRIYLVGAGALAEVLREEIAARSLDNVIMPGHFPIEQMPPILARASALLVTLKDVSLGRLTVPSKVQAYLAVGRPIIAALDGEGARVVEMAGAGLACPSENAEALADRILKLYRMAPAEREELGRNGKAFFAAHYEQGRLNEFLVTHVRALRD